MQYFLDFDRTIFDTDAMYQIMRNQLPESSIGSTESLDVIDAHSLLFPDALEFFSNHYPAEIFIVSSCAGTTADWDMNFQKEKINLSGVKKYVNEILVVEGSKVQAIKKKLKSGEGAVFVDDFDKHLNDVHESLSDIKVVQIDRLGKVGSGKFPIIKSLVELDNI